MAEIRLDGANKDFFLAKKLHSFPGDLIELESCIDRDGLREEIDGFFPIFIIGHDISQNEAEGIDFVVHEAADEREDADSEVAAGHVEPPGFGLVFEPSMDGCFFGGIVVEHLKRTSVNGKQLIRSTGLEQRFEGNGVGFEGGFGHRGEIWMGRPCRWDHQNRAVDGSISQLLGGFFDGWPDFTPGRR